MNDNEIIKGFAVCNDFEEGACKKCPYDRGVDDNSCLDDMKTDVYNLINRQKAENEMLIDLVNEFVDCNVAWVKDNHDLRVELKTAKSEAIREFVERLKAKRGLYGEIWESDIDKTVEEMTEETPS